ncbi:hypothetical protein [Kocuria arenosa]|uniref:hypothetical protein n=1 Tax=Kocuria arenosa TaxID=3071446 RepID=UPI0034D47048
MNKTSQTPAPTTFDSAGLAEKMASAITAQILETFGADGLLRQPLVRATVDEHLAHALRSLSDEGLAPVLEELHDRLADFRARDGQLLADPRYADAPEVTAVLTLQQWVGPKEDQAEPVGYPTDVFFPAAWLARQNRDQLERTATGQLDTDWIADELNLLGDHDGPFELELHMNWETDKNLLQEWVEATAP